VVTDLHGQIELRRDMDSGLNQGPDALLERVDRILREILAAIPHDLGSPLGIGLAVPAPITASTETVFTLPTYYEWGRLQLGEYIAAEFDLPVLVDNAANAAAQGEYLFGAGQGCSSMFYLLMHRGVGGAIVINGGVFRGAHGGAGEAGHMRLELDGPRCGCGNYGCLEAFVGRVAIRERAIRLFKFFGQTEIRGKALEEIKAQDVIDAALEGDERAQEILRDTGRYLGIGILNIMHLFNPELVIVGGSTARAGDLLIAPATEIVRQQVLPSVTREARVMSGELGEDAVAIGAAALALHELFDGSSSRESELVG
jgi:glucokinase